MPRLCCSAVCKPQMLRYTFRRPLQTPSRDFTLHTQLFAALAIVAVFALPACTTGQGLRRRQTSRKQKFVVTEW